MKRSKSNTVIITGATGFIGQACCKHLEKSGFDVIRVGRSSSDNVYCDLTLPDSVWNLNRLPAYKAFIHLGAHIGWDGSSLQDMYLPNVVSTALIADITRKHDAHLIFASAAIIAGLNAEEISVSSEDDPDTPYSKSKQLAEQCLNASGADATILRIGGVYGHNGPSHLGLNRTIRAALDGKTPIVYGTGSGKRNYVYVEDLASILVEVLYSRTTGTHLVGGADILSISEIYQMVCEVFDLSSPPSFQAGNSSSSQIISAFPSFTGTTSFSEGMKSIKLLAAQLS